MPQLINPHENKNSVNNISKEKQLNLSKIKTKYNDNFNNTKKIEEFFIKNNKQQKINEILKLKNDNTSNNNKNINNINNSREKKILDILFKKIEINKVNKDKKLIKKIKIGTVDNNNTTKNISHVFNSYILNHL